MAIETLPSPIWVSTSASMQKLAAELKLHAGLAVDTESNSLHAYREQLCLIQFSTSFNDFLVDPLQFEDLALLAPIFGNPQIEKIFHAAEYDLICLKRSFGISVVNIFDTMQAARILGYKQVGLDSMLAEKLGIVLNKKFQKADWAERPLSLEMLNYARLDTHHLLDLRDCLQAELVQHDRWDLALEEFARLAAGNGGPKAAVPSWQRVSGTQKFSKRQLAILNELTSWRESQAERMDRPVFKVIDDRRLVEIALVAPREREDLDKLMLTPRQVDMYGSYILQAVDRGFKAAPLTRPRSVRPKQAIADRLNALSTWRKEEAKKINIESDLVLPKGWMHSIAEQNPQTLDDLSILMPHSPWRVENFGQGILTAIHPPKKKPIKKTEPNSLS
jgi:ribonuclease D